ncbi:peptidoglycan editing factor PgeF [Chitinibacteraceae bacterium HSL-7]
MHATEFITPDWPAPANVRSLQTTRPGGVSTAPFAALNLGDHVGDDPQAVAENRRRVACALPGAPLWLTQVHGTVVADANVAHAGQPEADASVATQAGRVCAVMTADCLPVLLCNRAGTAVGAAHAGWRGLLDGVIEATVSAMQRDDEIIAWLGPAIGPAAFEVGDEVRAAFVARDARAATAFTPSPNTGRWLADIYALARQRLADCGITAVYGGNACTVSDAARYFSYRRDHSTGRMASLIWLE